MTQTAKERIEEEIKDVNRSLVYSLNKNGRAFNSGKRQGLTIALAHVENAGKSQQSKLSIPMKIADKLDNEDANSKTVLDWVFATEMIVVNNEKALERREDEILKRRAIVSIYGASKALGVELVEVTDE